MGESQLVHSKIAATHPTRKTPHVAIVLLSAAALVTAMGLSASGINELDIYSYTGTLGTFGYMVAYMLMGLGIPILLRRLAPEAGIAMAVLIGGTATLCLAYVFYRNVYPIPDWPIDIMPWLFLRYSWPQRPGMWPAPDGPCVRQPPQKHSPTLQNRSAHTQA